MVDINGGVPSQYTRQAFYDNDRMAGSVAVWTQSQTAAKGGADALALNDAKASAGNTVAPTFSFGELLDIVNPLQHIPVINKYYRNMTGDDISPVAKIIGGGLYGGAIGGVASIVNAAIQEHSSGHNTADALASAFKGEDASRYRLYDEERTAGLHPDNEKREPDKARVKLAEDEATSKSPYHFNT